MANKIIVYTKNNCGDCERLKWSLGDMKVDFRNIDEDPKYRKEFDEYGYLSAPLTIFPSGKVLSGFDMGEFAAELGY
ncbi:glutaredoxin family protein [Bacillus toyonensis]|uniref:glutaredoxin family protein n=1 Tax=Bacillus toyonensis TaxID=155322 RepID=UPI000BECD2AC|nr:glutaredoxin family protein [Bacillus toyonensis]PDY91455.1 NrdH-redoxin [Bacillus toyonensis]